MKLTKSVLKAAAIDLNDTAGLEPEIGYDEGTEKNTLSKMDAEELKEAILNEAGEFRKTDKYKDQTWDVLVELGVEIAIERAAGDEPAPKSKSKSNKDKSTPAKGKTTPAKDKASKATPAKKATTKKATKTSTPAKVKKPGVIATIVSLLESKPHTKDMLVAVLVKKFPDRKEDSMRSTVNVQVPGRIAREREVEVTKDSKGRYAIK